MKYLIELILSVVIIFFVWNTLKRIFLKNFYPGLYNRKDQQKQSVQADQKKKKSKKPIDWDAETIDFEEIEKKK